MPKNNVGMNVWPDDPEEKEKLEQRHQDLRNAAAQKGLWVDRIDPDGFVFYSKSETGRYDRYVAGAYTLEQAFHYLTGSAGIPGKEPPDQTIYDIP